MLNWLKPTNRPDLVIMETKMAKCNGIQIALTIKTKYPYVKLLILSGSCKGECLQKLLRAGVDGFLLKTNGIEQLVTAIQAVVKGERYYGSEVMKVNMAKHSNSSLYEKRLSPREKEVARLVAQGFSSQEIAEELCISKNTVSSHRRKILSKIEGKNQTDIVRFALHSGLVSELDLQPFARL